MANRVKSLDEWINSAKVSAALKDELRALKGEELKSAMESELRFGTSGLRGLMGAGNNRMNFHTVAKATQGLSQYLLHRCGAATVCVAYDTRKMSKRFAECAAMVLCANGFAVNLFPRPMPTPALSFAIRQTGAEAGIVITASHNPREYNGYKVYNSYGGQITEGEAAEILKEIQRCDIFDSPRYMELTEAKASGMLRLLGKELEEKYLFSVKELSLNPDLSRLYGAKLHILYTPLYGAGAYPVKRLLSECGYGLEIVEEQFYANGDFPTTPYPNPEVSAVYELALKQADNKTDILLATDPDGDRFGVMAREQTGKFKLLSGNEQAILICHYLLEQAKVKGGSLGWLYSSNVSTHMIRHLAAAYGACFEETLTGFKYIAEKVEALSLSGGQLVFAMEESNGCMAGDFLRDKDASIGALLISEVALTCKLENKTLWDRLEEIYQKWGYYLSKTFAIPMVGEAGSLKQHEIIDVYKRQEERIAATPRINIDYAGEARDYPWRFILADSPFLSVREKKGKGGRGWIAAKEKRQE